MTRDEMYEMHGLLHTLWSKSGTTAYDKREWGRLEALIGKAICTMIGPEADHGGYMTLITPKVQKPAISDYLGAVFINVPGMGIGCRVCGRPPGGDGGCNICRSPGS